MIIPTTDNLSWAHPLVRDWFIHKFNSPTEPQVQGWPHIIAGNTTLISAPTGSGKTFAAFLACLDKLIRKSLSGELIDCIEVLYVSPLKALSNDIQKNLLEPLAEIAAFAQERGLAMAEIQVAVRTGDTMVRDRQKMLKKPPHILVTTPESLYILLTAEKSRQILTEIDTVIIDEIHALVNSKRGAHLALSLERLQAICRKPPVRIGLSATQKPIEEVANFLAGSQRPKPAIINIGHVRRLDLAIVVPSSELGPIAANEMWDEVYDRIAELAQQNRSTLIFVNTRRLAERIAHHLAKRLGEELVAAHHGSLSRQLRLEAETKLKKGQLKALVATASLELGIDVGMIDLVCQIGSPRAIAIALQRVGRAGHWRGAISKGRIFVTTRDELVECSALINAIQEGDLDQLLIPKQPLDVLSQQIVATCATGDWREQDLFTLIKHAFPYADLSKESFDSILEMLAEGIAGSRGRYGAYLFRDRVNGIVRARRGSRLTAITNGGAIPENGLFTVIAEPEGIMVGTLDEDFAIESNRGDIILLGSTSWQIKRVENFGRVIVEDAHGAPPTVPFWRGEAPARTMELSLQVAKLRQKISDMLPTDCSKSLAAILWLKKNCGLDQCGAEQLLEYIWLGKTFLGAVPTQSTIIAERFFDEGGGMQLIIHAPFGARINKAWGLALRKRFCRSFNFELQAAATDDGLNISLTEQHSFPLADVFSFLNANSIKALLVQTVLQSPLFATRWRWDATRALALLRFRNGKKIPPYIARMLADDLLAAVFPDAAACQDNLAGKDIELPDHPLINEVMKDVLNEALDIEGLIQVLNGIKNQTIQCLAIDTPAPSVFAHEILNANPYAFLDDAPLEERRARAVEMRRLLPDNMLGEANHLDPAAIAEVKEQAWPDIRSADELHDFLQTCIAFPADLKLENYFNILHSSGRAGLALMNAKDFWFAVEKAKTFATIYPDIIDPKEFVEIETPQLDKEEAVVKMIRGWMAHFGPATSDIFTHLLLLNRNDVDQAFLKLENSGFILRGQFSRADKTEWCERRLLAKIHRLTLGKLRKEIEPVSAAQFMRWLLTWQHLASGTQLHGEHGLLEVIRQLQGYEIPANAWERQILAKRLRDYDPQVLDRLCLTGIIGWGRLSPHPAVQAAAESDTRLPRRITPTSVAPITFFIREQSNWMSPERFNHLQNCQGLSHVGKKIIEYLRSKGASFFADIVRGTGNLSAEIEIGLWELVSAGLVTADGFDNLRSLIDPQRRAGKSRRSKPRHAAGRWSLLHAEPSGDANQQTSAICWLLLNRYGVVFRDLLAREKNILPRWRDLLVSFRQLEDRGEIRGGRFVSGFIGEQFALPYVVESLRAIRKKELKTEILKISAVDPLNLVGIILPGNRVTAISGNEVLLQEVNL